MNTSLNNTPAATELAANFHVAELEPRLENGWSVTNHQEPENPCPAAGR